MIVEGYVLLHPECMKEKNGAHHIVAGSYETEEQRLIRTDRQCLGCAQTRRDDIHIPPYWFIGCDSEQIRERLERLQGFGAALCPGCAEKLLAPAAGRQAKPQCA